MKKDILREIEIPSEVEVNILGNQINVKGKEGEISREFALSGIEFKKEGQKIILQNKKSTKSEKKRINTSIAHIQNMIRGVQEKFEYQLKICFAHFPITVEVKENIVTVKNFLGEKVPRVTSIPKGAEVKVNKDLIVIKALDKEVAGQASANIEKITNIRFRDRRIFQDGIFLINKAGKEI